MKIEKSNSQVKDSSIQFMLAEYARITEFESNNRKSGDTRVNIFLTIASIFFAGTWTVWGTINKQSIIEIREFSIFCLLITFFLFFIGIQTFMLFLSRWKLTIIYLRKLARIRKWFQDLDVKLLCGLVFSSDEKKPSFLMKSFFSSSLLTLVMILNCTFVGIIVYLIIRLLNVYLFSNLGIAIICLISSSLTLLFHFVLYKTMMLHLEMDEFAAFPNLSESLNGSKM